MTVAINIVLSISIGMVYLVSYALVTHANTVAAMSVNRTFRNDITIYFENVFEDPTSFYVYICLCDKVKT